jgi:hypothetical protein
MRRWIVALAAVGVTTAVAVVIASVTGFASIDSFMRVDEGSRLVVVAIRDQGETILWSAVREQPDKVTVFVLRYRPPGSRLLLALRSNVEIQLNTPLGDRPVVDSAGQRVQETR